MGILPMSSLLPLLLFLTQLKGKEIEFSGPVFKSMKIDGDKVIVSSPDVPKPAAVRYAWANNPTGCNLYNKADLPAVPFRTDDW
jgi:hypothetical protein